MIISTIYSKQSKDFNMTSMIGFVKKMEPFIFLFCLCSIILFIEVGI